MTQDRRAKCRANDRNVWYRSRRTRRTRHVESQMLQERISLAYGIAQPRLEFHENTAEDLDRDSYPARACGRARSPSRTLTTCCVSIKRAHLDTSRFHEVDRTRTLTVELYNAKDEAFIFVLRSKTFCIAGAAVARLYCWLLHACKKHGLWCSSVSRSFLAGISANWFIVFGSISDG